MRSKMNISGFTLKVVIPECLNREPKFNSKVIPECLNRESRFFKSQNFGFTLIEMLVVIMIISILAAIGIPQYFRATEKARAAEATMLLGAIHRAEQRYMTRWGGASVEGNERPGSDAAWVTVLDVELPALKYFDPTTLDLTPGEVVGSTGKITSYTVSVVRSVTQEYNALSGIGTPEDSYTVEMDNTGTLIGQTPPQIK